MTSKPTSKDSRLTCRKLPRIGAFFDMDKTIIAENSGSMYMKRRYQNGDVTQWEIAKGLAAYVKYKLGVLDLQAYTIDMMLEFKGQLESELEEMGQQLFDEMIVHSIYPEARDLIREHQEQGHLVVIVSGATRFVVEPLAEHLGIDHLLCTRLEVENDRFTGRLIEPICFEEGKIYWVQQFIDEWNVDLAKSWFYTDSVTDLPLLELVGHPVVANPDPMLYRRAARRHWPVRFFEEPKGFGSSASRYSPRATEAS